MKTLKTKIHQLRGTATEPAHSEGVAESEKYNWPLFLKPSLISQSGPWPVLPHWCSCSHHGNRS